MNEFPAAVEKKVKLLNYFRNYMKEHLLKAGANMEVREEDQLSRIPALKTWFRTSRAVVMHLTNGTMQINFFKDHTKIILCPLLGAVTYIDETRRNRTFRYNTVTSSTTLFIFAAIVGLTSWRSMAAPWSCPAV